jgi:hypothetical protein
VERLAGRSERNHPIAPREIDGGYRRLVSHRLRQYSKSRAERQAPGFLLGICARAGARRPRIPSFRYGSFNQIGGSHVALHVAIPEVAGPPHPHFLVRSNLPLGARQSGRGLVSDRAGCESRRPVPARPGHRPPESRKVKEGDRRRKAAVGPSSQNAHWLLLKQFH